MQPHCKLRGICSQPRILAYFRKGVRSFSFNTLIVWTNCLPEVVETAYSVSVEGALKGKTLRSQASSWFWYKMLGRQWQFLCPSGNVSAIPTDATYFKVPWPDRLTVSIS